MRFDFDMDYKKLLGKRIKELRKRKGLTQEKLAELVNLEPASICNIENGYNYPSFQNLEKIISILNVSFINVFKFTHLNEKKELLTEINSMLNLSPEKIQDAYKVVKALIE